jgi:hypothetical protein
MKRQPATPHLKLDENFVSLLTHAHFGKVVLDLGDSHLLKDYFSTV